MQTTIFKNIILTAFIFLLPAVFRLSGQDVTSLTLQNAEDLALKNNHLLNVRRLQTDEKRQKMNEDRVKYLPSLIASGTYQYNSNLPSLTIEQGRFGQLPLGTILIPLPAKNEVIGMGDHGIYQAGVTLYQPVSQIGKIGSSVNVSKSELAIAQNEEIKAGFQVKQAVEKLYFGLLIIRKQIEEAEIRVRLAKKKLEDVNSALSAGKTTESGLLGLSAAEADEEQNLLKLKIQLEDYSADLIQMTGLDPECRLNLQPIPSVDVIGKLESIDTALVAASGSNNELKIASLYKLKADNAIKASKFSYLPDFGVIGGYTYQHGTVIYPRNNAFVGASFKWNIQDMLSNRTIQLQRIAVRKQAEENLSNTKEQVKKDIAKSYRKLVQSEELIKVAEKVVAFRTEDLKIQTDRYHSGLCLETDLLTARAALSKAESDLYAAQLAYRITLTELKILTGQY